MTRSIKNLLAGSFCALLYVGMAQAQSITFTVYSTTGTNDGICYGTDCTDSTNASPTQSLTGATLLGTLTIANGNDIDLNSSDSSSIYTLGTFAASESTDTSGADTATVTCAGGGLGCLADNLDDTFFVASGTVTVTSSTTITDLHDDGLTLMMGGNAVINAPGPTSAESSNPTVPTAGPYNFTLDYAECCGPPAELVLTGLNLVSSTPEPAAAILIPVMLLGVALVSRKRFSRSV